MLFRNKKVNPQEVQQEWMNWAYQILGELHPRVDNASKVMIAKRAWELVHDEQNIFAGVHHLVAPDLYSEMKYNRVQEAFVQARELMGRMPAKLRKMTEMYLEQSRDEEIERLARRVFEFEYGGLLMIRYGQDKYMQFVAGQADLPEFDQFMQRVRRIERKYGKEAVKALLEGEVSSAREFMERFGKQAENEPQPEPGQEPNMTEPGTDQNITGGPKADQKAVPDQGKDREFDLDSGTDYEGPELSLG